jgi:hypothetical protein
MLCANRCFPGYNHPVDEVLDSLLDCLDHPALPLLQWKEEMSFVESRLPAGRQAAGYCSIMVHPLRMPAGLYLQMVSRHTC